jgi:uncharacterized protein (TIGR02284 family)
MCLNETDQGETMAEEKDAGGLASTIQDAETAQLIMGGQGMLYPGTEAQYWREVYSREPYYDAARNFEDYGPAYELGWTGYAKYGGEFDTADRVLANDWEVRKGVSRLAWPQARAACRAAWQRAHNAATYATDGSGQAQEILETLQELLGIARDSDLGFMEAAEHAGTESLREFLERRARDCRDSARELQQEIERLGAQADDSGTVTAAAHRAWLQIRGLFGGASDEFILGECERAEAAALARMAQALQQNLPPEIHATVLRQFECTQRNHDAVKSLRAAARALAESDAGQAA